MKIELDHDESRYIIDLLFSGNAFVSQYINALQDIIPALAQELAKKKKELKVKE